MAHKNEEISAEEAAILLDLHPRTIRNLIQKRELQALKVKGRWYLDKASVMALKDNGVPLSEPHERAVTTQSLSLRGPHRLAAYRLCLHDYSLLPDLEMLDTETLSTHTALPLLFSQLKICTRVRGSTLSHLLVT